MAPRTSTAARRAMILKNVEVGLSPRSAAAASGVPFSSFYRWMEVGTFRDAIALAEATYEKAMIEQVGRAARRGSFRAAAWALERRFPDRWKERTELTGTVVPMEQTLSEEQNLSEIARLVGLAESRSAAQAGQRDETIAEPGELSRIVAGHDADDRRRRS